VPCPANKDCNPSFCRDCLVLLDADGAGGSDGSESEDELEERMRIAFVDRPGSAAGSKVGPAGKTKGPDAGQWQRIVPFAMHDCICRPWVQCHAGPLKALLGSKASFVALVNGLCEGACSVFGVCVFLGVLVVFLWSSVGTELCLYWCFRWYMAERDMGQVH
jgi:hypothetical protein